MASKEDLENRVYNNGLKDFRFTLSEASEGVLVLYHAPDGWLDAETTYSRHKVYGSVLRNTSTNELTFYKEGRDFIKNVYENTGIDANIHFTVEKLDKSTNTYVSYPSANKIDLSTYIVNEIGVSVQLIDTQFKEKVLNRDTTEIDLLKTTSIEGNTVTPFTVEQVTMPDTSIDLQSDYTEQPSTAVITDTIHLARIFLNSTDFTESRTPAFGSGAFSKNGAFFKESTDNRILTISGNIGYKFTYNNPNINGLNIKMYLRIIETDGTVRFDKDTVVYEQTFTTGGTFTTTANISEQITLGIGDSLLLVTEQTTTAPAGSSIVYDQTIALNCDETYTGNEETDVTAVRYDEAFLRVLEILSDQNSSFTSTFFSTEIGFITKGVYFRIANPIESNTIPIKLKDLFESVSAIFRLGMGYEVIGGVKKMRVEALDYFFDDTEVIDVSDRLRVEDIEKRVIPEMFYKACEVGYNKAEYENNAGLYEFNTKSTWSTVIKSVFNDFRKVSKYRADGQGMRLLLNAPYQTDYDSSEDVKGDDDIFLIDAVLDGSDYVARTDEGFTSITGSVYADASYNIRYSPARMLRNWGGEVRAGIKALNSLLRWQSTEKNTTLASKLTTESTAITENEDILVNDLTANRWYNEKYVIQVPLTVAELNLIDANPNGLIKLDTNKYGWILELKTKNKDGLAEIELLRCNLNVVTPT